ncbi:hypothetical protein ACJW31_11G186100 [Castanea mollissima]
MNGCFGCWEQERAALLQLKASINSTADIDYFRTWNSSTNKKSDCCDWVGVKCDNTTGRVIQLDLSWMISWSREDWCLNASLFLPFEELQRLNLEGNQISRWVPNEGFERFSALRKLEMLYLAHNRFNNNIQSSFSGISSLKILDLSDNKLNGSYHIQAFSSLEELYLNENDIDDFVTTKGSNNLGELQVLDLGWNKFSARIFESLSTFPSLKILYLGGNHLEGSFTNEGLCELRNLREIRLSGNHLEGILSSCMANWTSLHFLDLSDNHFSGNVQSLSDLRSLELLSLSNNEFLNPINFSSFFKLSNLKFLLSDNNKIAFETDYHTRVPTFQLRLFRLSECSFNGINTTLPTFLHYQYDLREIDLSHNNLSGKFPTWLLENNTRLEVLTLRNNSFTGSFLEPYEHYRHPNVREIDISSNYLQGPIPTNFGLIFPNLEYLDLSNNAFQGSIPSSFGNLVSMWALDLSKNNLSGTIPMHFTMGCYSLEILRLSNNNFSGQIFPTNFNMTNLEYLYLDNNHFSGKIPDSISLMIYVSLIDFSNNNLSGMLPVWMWNMTSLVAIVLANNQVEGRIPIELCKLISLEFFDLSENNLSGFVPSCFNLSGIRFFHLNKNSLSGPIPSAFQNYSSLVTLDLRDNYLNGNIPDWIGSVSSLNILLLGANHLEGRIPTELCLLQKLNLLDLSYNKFLGPIPPCLSNLSFGASTDKPDLEGLSDESFRRTSSPPTWAYPTNPRWTRFAYEEPTIENFAPINWEKDVVEFTTKSRTYSYKGDILNYMSGIDLSCNRLVGEIPPELGQINSIFRVMNLSHNNLTGQIPITFSNLKQMESLDLSYNNLNGKIPPQLTELTSLEVFSVAHNNLSGPLPDRKFQFGTFDENSYEGNPLLCGPPLHKDCTKIGPQSIMPVDHMEEKSGSFMDISVFYISFVVAYIIVLLGIVTVLYINPYWRKAWFNLIEECIDTCYCFVVVYYHKLFNFRLA